MTQAETEEVLVERHDSVSTITINRPRRKNALTYQTMIRLAECIEVEAKRPEVRALVLTGEGGSFSAGADLSSPADRSLAPEDGVRAANRIVQATLGAPVPVVARVPGPAAGLGVPIALAADVVVASEDAYFLLAFTKVGLMPDGGASLLLAASVGRARAMRMALRAEPVSAAAAAAMGLIDRAVPVDKLDSVVHEFVDHFVRGPRQAFVLTKRAINAATLDLLATAMERRSTASRDCCVLTISSRAPPPCCRSERHSSLINLAQMEPGSARRLDEHRGVPAMARIHQCCREITTLQPGCRERRGAVNCRWRAR